MPRNNYHQEFGNPLRRDRLPSDPLSTALPAQSGTRKMNRVLITNVVATIVMIDVILFSLHATISHTYLNIFRAAVTCIVSIVLIVVLARQLRALSATACGVVGFASSLGAAVAIIQEHSPHLRWLHSGVIASGYVWLYLRHWSERCITSPVSKKVADKLRESWRPSLALMAATPIFVAITACIASPAVAFILSIVVYVAYLVTTPLGRPRSLFAAGRRSFRSWLTYNSTDHCTPGTFRSPIGRCSTRCILTVGFSVVIGSCSWDAFPAPIILPSIVACLLPVIFGRPLIHEASVFCRSRVGAESWSSLVENVQSSSNAVEKESLYMGRVLSDQSPLLVPRNMHEEHIHILGDTGCGKTALGLAPFIEQVIGFGDCSVIVVDLKADSNELLATMIAAADKHRAAGRVELPLKYLSTQEDLPSYAFNPQTQAFWKQFNTFSKTDLLTGATDLNYGTDFGAAFFSAANEGVVNLSLESSPDAETFRELADQCGQILSSASNKQKLHPEMRRNGTHVHEILKRLAAFKPLNASIQDGYPQEVIDEGIDLADAFKRPQLMYFHLSSVLSPGAAPALARFVTYFLLASATKTDRTVPVYLVIDEFQRMVSRNFAYMLQLARSMGVRIVLANQSMEDLKTTKSDLISTIEANCRFRQWFSVSSSADRERLSRISGSTVELFQTVGESCSADGSVSVSNSLSERVVPRLDVNDIALASDHPKHSIVHITRGEGYAQYGGLPFIVESDFHITEKEYTRRKNMAWPRGDRGTFIPAEWNEHQLKATPKGPKITTTVVGESSKQNELFDDLLQDWSSESQLAARNGGKQ